VLLRASRFPLFLVISKHRGGSVVFDRRVEGGAVLFFFYIRFFFLRAALSGFD